MPSERFLQLQDQLRLLRTHLLPDQFDPTGTYDNYECVAIQSLAYRVLAHAEIESFFEDRALEAATLAHSAWESGRRVSHIAFCLLGFSGREMSLPPPTLEAPTDNKRKTWPSLVDIDKRLLPVISDFHQFIRSGNHGIKEKNLLSMLLPIGIEPKKIDSAFLAEMESFGALRGLAAHTSGKMTAKQGINPAEELKRVESLMPGIEFLDTEINTLIVGIPLAT
ncbi:hypothetical protein C8R21_13235 [Nitrosospira multiformis]|uniref:RiboL-PSP-HEPN domain-containing protein n=1 Tax=Nitrosospira multiformis TaxID=1231 RepID=A0A2T5I5V4_9PROT|nr:hypothetical protein [Nitrosospira multiformis]PTQ79215.1 hypothetical protein C8R21_13235 [Nitrosospira multiformis]